MIHKDEGKVRFYYNVGARCPVTEKRGFLGKPTMSGLCQVYYHDVTIYISLATDAEERGRGEI